MQVGISHARDTRARPEQQPKIEGRPPRSSARPPAVSAGRSGKPRGPVHAHIHCCDCCQLLFVYVVDATYVRYAHEGAVHGPLQREFIRLHPLLWRLRSSVLALRKRCIFKRLRGSSSRPVLAGSHDILTHPPCSVARFMPTRPSNFSFPLCLLSMCGHSAAG